MGARKIYAPPVHVLVAPLLYDYHFVHVSAQPTGTRLRVECPSHMGFGPAARLVTESRNLRPLALRLQTLLDFQAVRNDALGCSTSQVC